MKKGLDKTDMKNKNLATVSSGGFTFCRWGVMILVWIAFVFRIEELVLLSFVILLLSAILTVRRAPMIKVWDYTLGLFITTNKETLDVKAMRFAHSLGAVFSGVCVLLLYVGVNGAWWVVFAFAIVKTISALGFCPASKVYVCMSDGTCCAFSRKFKKMRTKK